MEAALHFRKGCASDLAEIDALVQAAILAMNAAGIEQWDEVYPTVDDFRRDCESGHLRVGEIRGRVAVVYVLNRLCDEEYHAADWQCCDGDWRVLHRLCVHPDFQNLGVGNQTMAHIEQEALNSGVRSLRLDVFTRNPYALRLYQKRGFRQAGTADWRMGRFLLMEKILG